MAVSQILESPTIESCPVKPLGHRHLIYYFTTSSGELVPLSSRDLLSPHGISALFGGDLTWIQQFREFEKDSRREFIDWHRVGRWLMQQCVSKGLWDPNTPVRGPGVWLDDDGNLVVHAGDEVQGGGTWQAAGTKIGRALYPAAAKAVRPSHEPATKEDGLTLLEYARCWCYDADIGPELIVGAVGVAMLGAAPHHRPHTLIIGKFGTGKTLLIEMMAAALGDSAQPVSNDVTPASLYQSFANEAKALLLDESEDDPTGSRMGLIIELLRRASTEEGAVVKRGSSGGKSTTYRLTASAILAATLSPPLKPQDRSRVTTVRLCALPANIESVGGEERVRAAITWAKKNSPRLRARAIYGWQRFSDTFKVYRSRLLSEGVQPRDANQIAAYLAGRDLLIRDDVPGAEEIAAEVQRFLPMVLWAAENHEEGQGQQALNRLFTSMVDARHEYHGRTIAGIIWHALYDEQDGVKFRAALHSFGLRVEGGKDGEPRVLWIAREHDFLRRAYQGSPWQNNWTDALRELDGACPGRSQQRFAGVNLRYTIIPGRWLPQADDPAFETNCSQD